MERNIIRPTSLNMTSTLRKYIGGLVRVSDADGRFCWAKLIEVDEFMGIFVSGYFYEGELTAKKTIDAQGLMFTIRGIMRFEKGDVYEIFGVVAPDEYGNLQHAYTPFDRFGETIPNEKVSINIFYLPGSDQVPKEISQLFEN